MRTILEHPKPSERNRRTMAKATRPNSGGAPSEATRGADGEETELFRAAVRDVKPLPPTGRTEPAPRPRRRRALEQAAEGTAGRAARHEGEGETLPGVALMPDVALADDSPTGAAPLSFRRPGVRIRTLQHLRRGLYPIEDEIDLHGSSQAEARDRLADFLARGRDAGRRCVRIVHGKGYRSGARGPILKIAVNTWLKRHTDVMAFTSARPIDGGTGAVYVLLRA
jgi:DNA-nicking Smr family endonuclease